MIFLVVVSFSAIKAQGFGYESKIDLGNGLYKVRIGDYYGIIDSTENVVVSMEYQDIVFRNGKALLTKDDVLFGIVDSLGGIRKYSGTYKVHPYYRYVYEGYIPVTLAKGGVYENRWGYINESEVPYRPKVKGVPTINPNVPTMFDKVRPFVEGCASVYSKRRGWIHIDKNGNEHYKLNDDKTIALFRSSLHNKECIIVTSDGIKLYQEGSDSKANVKRILSTSAVPVFTRDTNNFERVIYHEGVIMLDSLMRAYKFKNNGDSIVFFEDPNIVIQKSKPIKEVLDVKLVYKNLQAKENGKAYTEIKLENISEDKIENLKISIECSGVKKEWSGNINPNSSEKIPFNVPARFSESSVKRNILVKVSSDNENVEYKFTVTIQRYNPIRSR